MTQSQDKNVIEVHIRLQPPNTNIFRVEEGNTVLRAATRTFYFDNIFTPQSNQEDVFAKVGTKVVSNVLKGYNSCVFVYGQTGSGKTYTMTGIDLENHYGLIQRCMDSLWELLQDFDGFQIQLSYLQIYNQQIYDLLSINQRQGNSNIRLRQHKIDGFYVQNLKVELIQCKSQLNQFLKFGLNNRHKGATKMNRQSSRSHSILSLKVTSKSVDDNNVSYSKVSKLHFVDLAGSQKQKSTQATGDRLKEASNINKSLTFLSTVISKLASNEKHIPYRSSKLTTILKDSLSGNSKIIIIGTISCKEDSYQETISTLLFTEKAKKIKLNAKINEQTIGSPQQYKQIIKNLQQQIMQLKQQYSSSNSNSCYQCHECQNLRSQIIQLEKQISDQSARIQQLQNIILRYKKQQIIIEPQYTYSHSMQQDNQSQLYEIPQQNSSRQVSTFCSFNNQKQQYQNQLFSWPKYLRLQVQIAQKQREIQLLLFEKDMWNKQQQYYQSVCKLIQSNLKKLRFTQTQKIILEAQSHKFSQIRQQFDIEKNKWIELQKTYLSKLDQYQQRYNLGAQLSKVKSVQSQFVQGNKKKQQIDILNQTIANYKIRVQKLLNQNNQLQILKRLGETKNQNETIIQDLNLEIQTLKQTNQFLQQKIIQLQNNCARISNYQTIINQKILEINRKQQLLCQCDNYIQQLRKDHQYQILVTRELEFKRQLHQKNTLYQIVLKVNQQLKSQINQIRDKLQNSSLELKQQRFKKIRSSNISQFNQFKNELIEIEKWKIRYHQLQSVNKSLAQSQKVLLQQVQKNQTHQSLQKQKLVHQFSLLKMQHERTQQHVKSLQIDHQRLKKIKQSQEMKLDRSKQQLKELRVKYENLRILIKMPNNNKQAQKQYQDRIDYLQRKVTIILHKLIEILGFQINQQNLQDIYQKFQQYVEVTKYQIQKIQQQNKSLVLLKKTNEWLQKRNQDYLLQVQQYRLYNVN